MLVAVGDKVLMVGDPLALVVAESDEDAERAANLVVAGYEELSPVVDPEAALSPETLPIYPNRPDNLCGPEASYGRGDVEAAMAAADVVISRRFTTPRQEHACMEPESGIATAQGRRRHRDSCRHPGALPDRPQHRRCPRSDAGSDPDGGHAHGRILRRQDRSVDPSRYWPSRSSDSTGPVRIAWTSEESILVSTKRHPAIIDLRLGAMSDGRVIALKADCVMDGGPYTLRLPIGGAPRRRLPLRTLPHSQRRSAGTGRIYEQSDLEAPFAASAGHNAPSPSKRR